jgi:hypothetical protein
MLPLQSAAMEQFHNKELEAWAMSLLPHELAVAVSHVAQ